MKTSVWERYVVAIENEGHLEGGLWCETLREARKEAASMRADLSDPEMKHSILVMKVLRM